MALRKALPPSITKRYDRPASKAAFDQAAQQVLDHLRVLAGPQAQPQQMLVAGLVHANGGDDVMAIDDDAVDVDHQHLGARQAALVELGKLRRAGFDEAPGHRALGHPHRAGGFGQHASVAPRGDPGHQDVAHALGRVGVVAQPLIGRHVDLAAVLVTQPRLLHSQLALGQRDHTALRAVPEYRAADAPALLGPGQLLGRQHQQLLHQGDGRLVHQLVDARLRSFNQFQHRQQRPAAAGQQSLDLRTVVAMHDLQGCLCLTILHGCAGRPARSRWCKSTAVKV